MKTYYLPTDTNWDSVFFNAEPICIDRKEAERLYNEWYGEYGANYGEETEFDDLWREASEEEIKKYGSYDS